MSKDRKEGEVVVTFPHQRTVREQAADWLVRLDSDAVSARDRAEFKAWLNQSAEHRDELERLVGLWDDLNVLTELGRVRYATVVRPGLAARWSLAAAASVLLLVLSVAWVLQPDGARFETGVGEQQTIVLDDGTEAVLNTDTVLRVAYESAVRRVYLDQGEASFDVAHDESAPFEVTTIRGTVRAVGTSFTVRLHDNENELIVTEGIVEVDFRQPEETSAPGMARLASTSAKPPLVRIEAGRQVMFDAFQITAIEEVDRAEMDQRLAWQHGMLYYDGEDLEKVVEDVSRYTSIEIVIPEPAARNLRVGGYFRTGDITSLLEALEQGFGIKVEYVSDELVYLKYPEAQ